MVGSKQDVRSFPGILVKLIIDSCWLLLCYKLSDVVLDQHLKLLRLLFFILVLAHHTIPSCIQVCEEFRLAAIQLDRSFA